MKARQRTVLEQRLLIHRTLRAGFIYTEVLSTICLSTPSPFALDFLYSPCNQWIQGWLDMSYRKGFY